MKIALVIANIGGINQMIKPKSVFSAANIYE